MPNIVLLRNPDAFCPWCHVKLAPHGTDIYSGRPRWRCDKCVRTTTYPYYREVKGRKFEEEGPRAV